MNFLKHPKIVYFVLVKEMDVMNVGLETEFINTLLVAWIYTDIVIC